MDYVKKAWKEEREETVKKKTRKVKHLVIPNVIGKKLIQDVRKKKEVKLGFFSLVLKELYNKTKMAEDSTYCK